MDKGDIIPLLSGLLEWIRMNEVNLFYYSTEGAGTGR